MAGTVRREDDLRKQSIRCYSILTRLYIFLHDICTDTPSYCKFVILVRDGMHVLSCDFAV